jgi:Virulence activator alpha C-term
MLVRLFALDSVDIDPLRADLMARLEHHRDRYSHFERILHKRFPHDTASPADTGKLLCLRMGLRYERAVAEWCEEALDTLSATAHGATVTPIDGSRREENG